MKKEEIKKDRGALSLREINDNFVIKSNNYIKILEKLKKFCPDNEEIREKCDGLKRQIKENLLVHGYLYN